jgi:hypothetical protein
MERLSKTMMDALDGLNNMSVLSPKVIGQTVMAMTCTHQHNRAAALVEAFSHEAVALMVGEFEMVLFWSRVQECFAPQYSVMKH